MKLKIYLLALLVFCLSCNNRSKEDIPISTETGKVADPSKNTAKAQNDTGLVGEWEQVSAVSDMNGNGSLEMEERSGKKMKLGFNYFQFHIDGSCVRDSDLKFNGSYEVEEKGGSKKLNIQTDPPGETYSYNIIGDVRDELVLMASGIFLIYKRK